MGNGNDGNYIDEKNIKDHPKSLSIEQNKIILEQMEKCVCKINCNDGGNGTGFFCKIPFPDTYHLLPILMTNNHVLNNKEIGLNKKINITLNNDQKNYQILLDDSRKAYTIEKPYDVTFIEIKKEDGLDIDKFLEIDNQIFENNPNEIYLQKTIYLLHYPKGEELKYSLGVIHGIKNDTIYHFCDSERGSSGGPLIYLNSFKVIGIHKGSNNNDKNLGTLLKVPIENFVKKHNVIKDNNNINNNTKYNIQNLNVIDDEITIEYDISGNIILNYLFSKKIKIFGENFVKNNKDLCKLYIFGEEYELCSYFNKKEIRLNKDKLKIKLRGINNVIDLSGMFEECSSLLSLPDISKWNTSNNIINMRKMFYGCSSLLSLPPEFSNLNTSNVEDMSLLFGNCSSLTSLPDISKWNTTNVKNIGGIFSGCHSLTSLSDISKWNTTNNLNMSILFFDCHSLTSLPDISKWNTSNVTDMSFMFFYCKKLEYLPDISKWDTKNVITFKNMFSSCCKLSSLPDISNWNTSKLKDTNCMFSDCKSLTTLPNILKWNVNFEEIDCGAMFIGMKRLSDLPNKLSVFIEKNNKDIYFK